MVDSGTGLPIINVLESTLEWGYSQLRRHKVSYTMFFFGFGLRLEISRVLTPIQARLFVKTEPELRAQSIDIFDDSSTPYWIVTESATSLVLYTQMNLASGLSNAAWGWNVKEIQRKKLRLTWDWAEVLCDSCPWLILFKYSAGWHDLKSSLCPYVFNICTEGPKVSLRWEDLRLNIRTHND